MSSSPKPTEDAGKLTPNFGGDGFDYTDSIAQEIRLFDPRFVFSPLIRINTRFDLCAFDEIRPGEITMVDNHLYQDRNEQVVVKPDGGESEFITRRRAAGIITARLLENNASDGRLKTGFCVLEELTGMNPKRDREDRKLILDLQKTLLPRAFETGEEQREYLMETGMTAAKRKGDIYVRVIERLIRATEESIYYADEYVSDLRDEIAQGAAGVAGMKRKVDREDKRICDWIDEEYPEIASPLTRKAGQNFDPQQFAQMIAQANAATLAQMATLLQGQQARAEEKPAKGQRQKDEKDPADKIE